MNSSCLPQNMWLIRKKWNEAQKDFASRLGMTPGNLSRIEKGVYSLSGTALSKLSELTGISTKRLLEEPLRQEDIPYKPVTEGSPEVSPVIEDPGTHKSSSDNKTLEVLVEAVKALTASIEAERAENALYRKRLKLLEKRLEYIDTELLRLAGKKK